MSLFKKIMIGFLSIVLINLIGLAAISFNLKSIIINGVIKETIASQMIANQYNNPKYTIPEEEINKITDNEQVRELLNTPEIQSLLEEYLDKTVNSLISENEIDSINLEEDMLAFLKENKSVIEGIVGQEITDEMIEETTNQLETKDMSSAFKQSLINARNNMNTNEKNVLKGYSFLISDTFRIIVLVLIILDLLLIAIIQKSIYKWIKTLSISLIVSGIGIVLVGIIVNKIVISLTPIEKFDISSLLKTGIIVTITGILLLVIYKIIEIILNKKKENGAE